MHDQQTIERLINDVLPALSAAIDEAGTTLAQDRRVEPHSGDIEQARQELVLALADLLGWCEMDHSEDHIWGVCTAADLRDSRIVREFFELPEGKEAEGAL